MSETTVAELKKEFDSHLKKHKDCELKNKEIMLEINQQQKLNTEAIAELTTSTQGLVDAWTAANTLSKFMKWLASFAIVATGLAWFSTKISEFPFFGK